MAVLGLNRQQWKFLSFIHSGTHLKLNNYASLDSITASFNSTLSLFFGKYSNSFLPFFDIFLLLPIFLFFPSFFSFILQILPIEVKSSFAFVKKFLFKIGKFSLHSQLKLQVVFLTLPNSMWSEEMSAFSTFMQKIPLYEPVSDECSRRISI